MHLLPCPGCDRHVRASDPLCPFCGEALPMSLRQGRAPALPTRRLGRAATFAFGAAVAASSAVGCGDGPTTDDAGVVMDGGAGLMDASSDVDGGPIDEDAGSDAGGAEDDAGAPGDGGSDAGTDAGSDGGVDGGNIVPPYGTPPDDGGGVTPLYGGPTPLPDAGSTTPADGGGGFAPLYGGSPA